MLLINKHSRIDNSQLLALLNFALEDVGYTTDHVGITVLAGSVANSEALTIHTNYLNENKEEVCCEELFPEYEEVGDKYGCGLSIMIEVYINERAADVDREIEIEHIRLQSLSAKPIPVKSWEDEFVFEMAKLAALLKESGIGQFIHKRHWWYRVQKHALERLLKWNSYPSVSNGLYWGVDSQGAVDLFEEVFKLKPSPADSCARCAKWEKDYIELQELYDAVKKEAVDLIKELHVAKTLHDVAVKDREKMAAEVLLLKLEQEQE